MPELSTILYVSRTAWGVSPYLPYYEYRARGGEDRYGRNDGERVEGPIAGDFHTDLGIDRTVSFLVSGAERIAGPVDACLLQECVDRRVEVAQGRSHRLVVRLYLGQLVADGRCDGKRLCVPR